MILTEIGSPPDHIISEGAGRTQSSADLAQPSPPTGATQSSKFGQMMKLKSLHIMAIFIFIYVGVEVTIGGELIRSTEISS